MSPADRTHPPEPGALRSFDFPEVSRLPLFDGIDLRVAPVRRVPMVAVHLFVRAGEAALDEARAGLAVLAGDCLEAGTRRRGGVELAEALERIGARLGASTGWEGTTFHLSCLADRLEDGMGLLAEAVREPSFPEGEVARVRAQQIADLRRRAADPTALADDHLRRAIFAASVPYRRPLEGSEESVASHSADALRGYADAHWRPAGGGLVVAGDVDAEEARRMASRMFEGWEGGGAGDPAFEVRPAAARRRVLVVDRPGAVQSEVRVGHVGIRRADPDAIGVTVLNTVLGGSFTSRLNLNLRERHGFTYGVRSRFSMRGRPGPFVVSTAVGTDVTAAALEEILAEVEGLRRDGPTEEEVASARDYIAGVFPLRLETVSGVAGRVTEVLIYGLPEDYYRTYRDRVRAVSRDEAADLARRHLRPREAQIVVVGDAETVAPALEGGGLGPVEVVKAAG